ncbi:unnamed protein product [Prorocentrum cordatum]|uniref:JmjC domain-containing protein n=1 Tax=Prorocentrum cordatum TaxID=2364126 RepID=A0ABN9REK8_9DINO|nr:unnamed protein product [Polarella glacialis]
MVANLIDVHVVLEQPMSSVFDELPFLADYMARMIRVPTWLGSFGAPTAKPLKLFTTSDKFRGLRRSISRIGQPLAKLYTTTHGKTSGKKTHMKDSEKYTKEFAAAVMAAASGELGGGPPQADVRLADLEDDIGVAGSPQKLPPRRGKGGVAGARGGKRASARGGGRHKKRMKFGPSDDEGADANGEGQGAAAAATDCPDGEKHHCPVCELEVNIFDDETKATGADADVVYWHHKCRGAARYLENAALARDAREHDPAKKVHMRNLRDVEKNNVTLWRKQVLGLVVEDGRYRTAVHRDAATKSLDTLETYSRKEQLDDVIMLDFDEFCAHHAFWKRWDDARCEIEWDAAVNDPRILKEGEGVNLRVPVALPKKYRGIQGVGESSAIQSEKAHEGKDDIQRAMQRVRSAASGSSDQLANMGGQAQAALRVGAAFRGASWGRGDAAVFQDNHFSVFGHDFLSNSCGPARGGAPLVHGVPAPCLSPAPLVGGDGQPATSSGTATPLVAAGAGAAPGTPFGMPVPPAETLSAAKPKKVWTGPEISAAKKKLGVDITGLLNEVYPPKRGGFLRTAQNFATSLGAKYPQMLIDEVVAVNITELEAAIKEISDKKNAVPNCPASKFEDMQEEVADLESTVQRLASQLNASMTKIKDHHAATQKKIKSDAAKDRYRLNQSTKRFTDKGCTLKIAQHLDNIEKETKNGVKASLVKPMLDDAETKALASKGPGLIDLAKNTNLNELVKFCDAEFQERAKRLIDHLKAANGKGNLQHAVTIEPSTRYLELYNVLFDNVVEGVPDCMLFPWNVGIAENACRSGFDCTGLAGLPQVVYCVAGEATVLLADIAQLIQGDGQEMDDLAKLITLLEGCTLEMLGDRLRWIVLEKGQLLWVPAAFVPFYKTATKGGCVVSQIPALNKLNVAADGPLVQTWKMIIDSLAKHASLRKDCNPWKKISDKLPKLCDAIQREVKPELDVKKDDDGSKLGVKDDDGSKLDAEKGDGSKLDAEKGPEDSSKAPAGVGDGRDSKGTED